MGKGAPFDRVSERFLELSKHLIPYNLFQIEFLTLVRNEELGVVIPQAVLSSLRPCGWKIL